MLSNVNWIKFALLQDGEEDLMAVPALKSIVDVEQTSESGSSTSEQEDQPSKLFIEIFHFLISMNVSPKIAQMCSIQATENSKYVYKMFIVSKTVELAKIYIENIPLLVGSSFVVDKSRIDKEKLPIVEDDDQKTPLVEVKSLPVNKSSQPAAQQPHSTAAADSNHNRIQNGNFLSNI